MRIFLGALFALVSCGGSTAVGVDGGPSVADVRTSPASSLDLLLVIDDSGSMARNQALLAEQFDSFLDVLANPPDSNGDGRPDYPAIRDLHIGVVSTDLGSKDGVLVDCPARGDDGFLNPLRYGLASSSRGSTGASGLRPSDCATFPPFLAFAPDRVVAPVAHDVLCNVALSSFGCGIEQPLEAAYRAVVWRRADNRPDNDGPNAGFLREDAQLAILVLSDEDDGSVRDCSYAERGSSTCVDATDVFDATSSAWAGSDINLRFYLDQPCSAQDPTWPLDRYVDPRQPGRGFPGLKPGHPERVMFAAITGVPLEMPTRGTGNGASTDWDALLGAPDPASPDDFCRRRSATAITTTSREGPISMRQANPDPQCPALRVVPACRGEGSRMADSCDVGRQYAAWPARRLVEVARRFDESALCAGHPCHNGIVSSICAGSFRGAMTLIGERIR